MSQSGPESELNPSERQALQKELMWTMMPEEAGHLTQSYFLPLLQHREMLQRQIVVVIGERGAGKTALFRFLSELGSPALLAEVLPGVRATITWRKGYAEEAREFPAARVLTQWLNDHGPSAMEAMWRRLLVARISQDPALPPLPPPLQAVRAALKPESQQSLQTWAVDTGEDRALCYAWLDQAELALGHQRRQLFVGYDDLDMIGVDRELQGAASAVRALLQLWLPLSRRLENIQARVFLRPDLFELSSALTRDASKIRQQSLTLVWSGQDVFRVLLRHISASEALRDWLEREPDPLRFQRHPRLGYLPPEVLPEFEPQLDLFGQPLDRPLGHESQRLLARRLVGDVMGTGLKKGYSHRWILNHTQDGLGRHLPRVTLNLIRCAARAAIDEPDRQASGSRLLLPAHLVAAQKEVGEHRLHELSELRDVEPLIKVLRDGLGRREVPMPWQEAIFILRQEGEAQPEAVLGRLLKLGLILRRPARGPDQVERLDLPEIFRAALHMMRKGGPLQIPKQTR